MRKSAIDTRSNAAINGHPECLKYLPENGCPGSTNYEVRNERIRFHAPVMYDREKEREGERRDRETFNF